MSEESKHEIDPLITEISDISYATGITRTELAMMMGVTRSKLASYTRGVYRPRIDTVRAWLDCLSYTVIPIPKKFEEQVRILIAELNDD